MILQVQADFIVFISSFISYLCISRNYRT